MTDATEYTDCDGDRWIKGKDGLYTCYRGLSLIPHNAMRRTLREVSERYGPLKAYPCVEPVEPVEPVDIINHPPHYTSHPSGIECIQVTEHMSFTLGNAVKYIWRADLKSDKLEDLRKARWYLDREISRIEASG